MSNIEAKASGPASRRARRRQRRQYSSVATVDNIGANSTEPLFSNKTSTELGEGESSHSESPQSPAHEPASTSKTLSFPFTQPNVPLEAIIDLPENVPSDPTLLPLNSTGLELEYYPDSPTERRASVSEPATPEIRPQFDTSEPTTPTPLSFRSRSSSLIGVAPDSMMRRGSTGIQPPLSSPTEQESPSQLHFFSRFTGLAGCRGKARNAGADSNGLEGSPSRSPRRPSLQGSIRAPTRTAESNWLRRQYTISRTRAAKLPNTCAHGMDKDECLIERRMRKQRAMDKKKEEDDEEMRAVQMEKDEKGVAGGNDDRLDGYKSATHADVDYGRKKSGKKEEDGGADEEEWTVI